MFSGLSLHSDDNEFIIINSPTSPTGIEQNNDDIDDEIVNTIVESEQTIHNRFLRLRQNSTPTTFSTLKTAILNGISLGKNTYIIAFNHYFLLN
jgi:hypothetical protein